MSDLFEKNKRQRNQAGTVKKDVGWGSPLVGGEANAVEHAGIAGGGAALVGVKEYAKKQITK